MEFTVNLSDDERDLIALHLVTGIGPRLTAALLDHFGSASAILKASVAELQQVPYLGAKAEALTKALANPDVAKEIEQIDKHGVHLRVKGRPEYPQMHAMLVALFDFLGDIGIGKRLRQRF